jgi:glycosyltransferase involved in cell wall biosynthesis
MRILTCVGDATVMATHGGLPYHLLEAGRRAGFLDGGWQLRPDKLKFSRSLWNAARLVTHGEWGGYQYTERFLRALLSQVPPQLSAPDDVISIFPLLPVDTRHRSISFYIDATLTQNFFDYGIGKNIGRAVMCDALARERQAYENATRIVCRSRAAARSVIEIYGIDARKVHIVPGGANLPVRISEPSSPGAREATAPIRLGFLGKDWRRKNLPFLLEVADVLYARGIAVEVWAAGFEPSSGPRHPRMKTVGFIDKRASMEAFVRFIQACHFMCLFSHSEAFGLANRESLALGVPVLASNVGGIPDTVPRGCGHLFDRDARADDVADVIASYATDPDRYAALRETIARRAHEFTWAAAVDKLKAIWTGSQAHNVVGGIPEHA